MNYRFYLFARYDFGISDRKCRFEWWTNHKPKNRSKNLPKKSIFDLSSRDSFSKPNPRAHFLR